MVKVWMRDPHSGGVKIPALLQEVVRERVIAFAEKNYSGKFTRLDIRFKGHFCYIDAYTEPEVPSNFDPVLYSKTREEYVERLRNTPTHLCRLRYHGQVDSWSMDFYTYSNEKYEPCVFENGSFFGTPEEAFKIGAIYLQ